MSRERPIGPAVRFGLISELRRAPQHPRSAELAGKRRRSSCLIPLLKISGISPNIKQPKQPHVPPLHPQAKRSLTSILELSKGWLTRSHRTVHPESSPVYSAHPSTHHGHVMYAACFATRGLILNRRKAGITSKGTCEQRVLYVQHRLESSCADVIAIYNALRRKLETHRKILHSLFVFRRSAHRNDMKIPV